jgi:hypothetical protein
MPSAGQGRRGPAAHGWPPVSYQVSEAGSPEGGAFHLPSLGGLAWGPLLGGKAPRPTVLIL